jgi:hypothetical protein
LMDCLALGFVDVMSKFCGMSRQYLEMRGFLGNFTAIASKQSAPPRPQP